MSQLPDAAPGAPFNFAAHLFALNAGRGGQCAFVDDTGSLSYGELADQARRLAAALLALGLRPEERVLLLMHDTRHWPVCFLAALHAGVVPVAVNTLLSADEYAYMIGHCRAQAVLVSAPLLPVLGQALAQGPHQVRQVLVSRPQTALGAGQIDIDALIRDHAPQAAVHLHSGDTPAFWLYSSGSTGRPKGTVHTHANLWWTAKLYGQGVLALNERDVCFSAAKLYFAYGLGNALTFPLAVGASVVLMAERPTPDAVFKRLCAQTEPLRQAGLKPTAFFGAPTGYVGMLASPQLPTRSDTALRLAVSAGEALPAETGQRFKAHFGIDLLDGIGSTEMLHIYLSNAPGRLRYGCTGWPVPGYEIELRGDDGRAVPDGELGDMFIKGPSAALLYWGNREKSRETFQGAWTKSGDKYLRNSDGSYTYSGRGDDMLRVSGQYVSPFEVEATLMQHGAVLEAAVVGIADADGLTKTKAFVVLKAGAAGSAALEAELKEFVKGKLAPHKYPRLIEFVAELPKTATGKIQRFRLRASAAAKPA